MAFSNFNRTSKLDLVIINPGAPEQVYQSLATSLAAVEPPVWAGMIATFARIKGYSVEIIDANALRLSPAETASRVAGMDPALTVVVVYGQQPSASTQNMPASGAVCTAIKQNSSELKTAMIGGHVAALPDRTLIDEDVDFVSTGEGLITIIDLVDAIKADDDDYSKVRGLHYWKDGIIQRTPNPPLLGDLDAVMPGIAWDLLPMDLYRAHNWHCFGGLTKELYASIYTTLGCPYRSGKIQDIEALYDFEPTGRFVEPIPISKILTASFARERTEERKHLVQQEQW